VKLLGKGIHQPLPRWRGLSSSYVRCEAKKSRAELRGSPDLWPKAADHGSTSPRTNGQRHPLECRSEYSQFHAVGVSSNRAHEGFNQDFASANRQVRGAMRNRPRLPQPEPLGNPQGDGRGSVLAIWNYPASPPFDPRGGNPIADGLTCTLTVDRCTADSTTRANHVAA